MQYALCNSYTVGERQGRVEMAEAESVQIPQVKLGTQGLVVLYELYTLSCSIPASDIFSYSNSS